MSNWTESAYFRKLRQFERYLGLHKLTDEELSRLAAPEFPDGFPEVDRTSALVAIARRQLRLSDVT